MTLIQDEFLTAMIKAAEKAAHHIVSYRHQSFTHTRKCDNSIVLNIDLECEKIISESLRPLLPLVSEEDEATHNYLGQGDTYFLVDPLDGTSACKRYLTAPPQSMGFGPLVSLVRNRKIDATVFVHIATETLFVARKGNGVYSRPLLADYTHFEPVSNRIQAQTLNEAVVLFYLGGGPEAMLIEYLKSQRFIDNAYRLGGFANDCMRLLLGYEEVLIKLTVRPWDVPAVLLAYEAGFQVIMDPFGTKTPFELWELSVDNPVIVGPSHIVDEFIAESFRYLSRH